MLTYEIVGKGGNFIRCFSLAQQLHKMGHQVDILCSNSSPCLKNKTYIKNYIKIIETACIFPQQIRHDGRSPIQIINRIHYLIKHHDYDIIHGFSHRPSVFFPCLFAKNVLKKIYIADWCDLWGWGGLANLRTKPIVGKINGSIDTLMEKMMNQTANGITVITQDLYDRSKNIRHSPKNIVKIGVGADTDNVLPLSKKIMRQKNKISLRTPLVVHLGNANYDADFLGKIFVELHKMNSQIKLMLIGTNLPSLEILIKENHLESQIINVGFVPHDKIGQSLACGDVMILPYTNKEINRGRYPNKIGDYMAAAKATVSNPTAEIKIIFQKYGIGLLASENPKKFAQKVNFLLTHPLLRKKIEKKALSVAKNELSWFNFGLSLENFYSQQLSTPKI